MVENGAALWPNEDKKSVYPLGLLFPYSPYFLMFIWYFI